MIVDDDKEFLDELSDLMLSSGYDVCTCIDGARALAEIPEVMPDIILLDLKMNNINGFQVAVRLKAIPKACDIPIIAMTGYYTQDEYALMIKICGIKKFIIKTADPGNIVREVKLVLAGLSTRNTHEKANNN